MSTIVLRRGREPLDLIERIFNKSTLTTQRVAHRHVVRAGELVMKDNFVDVDAEKTKAVKEALTIAERRHKREIKAVAHRLEKELEADKLRALDRQQRYYDELAKRVSEQRDKAEEQRRRELRRHFDKEKEEALRQQKEEMDQEKLQAIDEACELLRKKLRNEFALEKEKAIGDALTKAREHFRIREQEVIEQTRQECQRAAEAEAARVAKLHAEEISRMEKRYQLLLMKYHKEVDHKEKVERDFKDLQTDYKRFLNYTDGYYHSDYMMHLRSHGSNIANKRVSVVTYEDVEKLDLNY